MMLLICSAVSLAISIAASDSIASLSFVFSISKIPFFYLRQYQHIRTYVPTSQHDRMHKIWILKFYSHLQNKSHLLAKMCDTLELEYFVKEVGAMFDGVARASVPMLARALVSQAIGSRL